MAPRNYRKTNRREFDSPKKSRFFAVYNTTPGGVEKACEKLKEELYEKAPSQPTASRWLKQRKEARALQETDPNRRRGAKRPGRPWNISEEQLEDLLHDETNKFRDQDYETQIDRNRLNYQPHTLEHSLRVRKKARRFKKQKVKQLTGKSREERNEYATEYGDKHLLSVPGDPKDNFPGPW